MDYAEIKKMMKDMEEMKLSELSIEFPDGTKVSLKKEHERPPFPPHMPGRCSKELIKSEEKNMAVIPEEKKDLNVVNECVQDDVKVITSPMVGTYYEKSSPTAEKFVEVGKKVKKGDVLCIIEAMKLMNEIESEYDGEIVEILVKDGEMVDYGKPLFKIK